MIKIEYLFNNEWIDISGYTTRCDNIPFISRNRDFSSLVESINIEVAATVQEVLESMENLLLDGEIRISINSQVFFHGYIDIDHFSHSDCIHILRVKEMMGKSRELLINYDTLHTTFETGVNSIYEYRPISYFNGATVGVLFTLKKMFELMGFSLDTSQVEENIIYENYTFNFQSPSQSITKNILLKDLFFAEESLYNLGRSSISFHTITVENSDTAESFFRLIYEVMGCFGLCIKFVSEKCYKLISGIESEDFNPNNIFEYDEKLIKPDYDQSNSKMTATSGRQVANYLVTKPIPCYEYSVGSGSNLIKSYLTNMIFFFEHTRTPLTEYKEVTNVVDGGNYGNFSVINVIDHGLNEGDFIALKGIGGCGKICIGNSGRDRGTDAQRVISTQGGDNFTIESDGKENSFESKGWIIRCDSIDGLKTKYQFDYLRIENTVANGSFSNYTVRAAYQKYTRQELTTNLFLTEIPLLKNFIDIWSNSNIVQEKY